MLRLKSTVSVAAMLGALIATSSAMAQNSPSCTPNSPQPCTADQSVETVIVTGSRIPRPEADSPNPVQSVSAEDIQHSGETDITQYLKRIPALVGSLGDAETSSNAGAITDAHASLEGLNLLGLRNLGFERTLVLEDNQRIVASVAGTAGVDINTIPITLIDRVDVVTGGSSAVYGADGVSGVVNFIMKHDLDGITARVQANVTQDGGGNNYLGAASVGHNFDNGNGNVTVTYEQFFQNNLNYTQRSFTRIGGFGVVQPNPANPVDAFPNIPANLGFNNVTIPFVGGTGILETLAGNEFNGNGSVFQHGTTLESGEELGGQGLPFAPAAEGDFDPIEHRQILQAGADDQFNRWLKLSGEFRFAHVDTKTNEENPFWEDLPVTNQNPFIPANVRSAIAAQSFGVTGPDGSLLGLDNEFPYQIPGTNLIDKTSRDIYRGVLGASGDFPAPDFMHDAKWQVNYVYGQTDISDTTEHDMVADRLTAAMDVVIDPATGNPTCRSNIEPGVTPPDLSGIFGVPILDAVIQYPTSLFGSTFTPGANSGCSPFNPFSPTANNKAAIQFVYPSETTTSELTQQDINGFVSFDLPQWQDWGMAGPLAMVLGGEWRQETSKSVSPADTVAGFYGPGAPSPFFGQGGPEVAGRFHVAEGFGEVTAPILADKPFAQELTFHAAGRVSDYSTAGTDETWTMDGVWAPISGVKFRGSDSYAVRAPNIGELFSPQQVVFEGVTDPCDAADVHAGTAFRIPNCEAIFKALNVTYVPGVTETTSNTTPQVNIGGNPNLKPETARTQTLGVVLQPDFIPNLTMTVDWWRVNIANAIEAPSATNIASECVDLSTISNPFCANVTRTGDHPLTGQKAGQITFVTAQEINVATFFTQGTDFTAAYHANLDDWFGDHYGLLDLHLVGSHLDVFETTPLPGQAPVKSENVAGGGSRRWPDAILAVQPRRSVDVRPVAGGL